jgi:hypothetical protein
MSFCSGNAPSNQSRLWRIFVFVMHALGLNIRRVVSRVGSMSVIADYHS